MFLGALGVIIILLLIVVIVLLLTQKTQSKDLANYKAMEERLIRMEGEISKINQTLGFVTSVYNPLITYGGYDIETVENAMNRITWNLHSFTMMIRSHIWLMKKHVTWNIFHFFFCNYINVLTISINIYMQVFSTTFCPVIIRATIFSTYYIHSNIFWK